MQKFLHLFSGGLDSILSYKIIERAGYEVKAVYFETPFFPSKKPLFYGNENSIEVRTVNIFSRYISMLKSPKYGYGKNLNPCIDCKALMINIACEMAEREGFDFVSTGEVLGQRPMSQTKGGFIKQKKLLKHPEKIIKILSRDDEINSLTKLPRFSFSGRERDNQMKLAEELEVKEFQTPSGGCLLTYREFSQKAEALLEMNLLEERYFYLIRSGRFKRFSCGAAVIGRDENDNNALLETRRGERAYQIRSGKGPVALVLGELAGEETEELMRILLAYSKGGENEKDSVVTL